ncbi:MAG: hypothetical protein V5A48_03365 [Salinivenus sp.]
MNDPSSDPTPWWGPASLDLHTGGEWHVGPTTLWVYRSSHDWRVVVRPSTDPAAADPMAQRSGATLPVADDAMSAVLEADDDALTTHRFSAQDTDESVALRPALADRAVVTRPEHPLSVLPDEAVTLYLSTPLWVRVELVESGRRLTEIPSHRMSDTWFGPSTREGTLCYATRTAGRLHLDRLPRRLHRALTPLTVQNRTAEPLALERIQLPVPHLSLYVTVDDAIWTDPVTMTHRTKGEGAAVQIREGPPSEHPEAEPIQAPREDTRQGLFTSTFSAVGALFGP